MIVEVSMKNDQDKFTVHGWWATGPEFVIAALTRQLHAAAAVWPALDHFEITEKAQARPSPANEVSGPSKTQEPQP